MKPDNIQARTNDIFFIYYFGLGVAKRENFDETEIKCRLKSY